MGKKSGRTADCGKEAVLISGMRINYDSIAVMIDCNFHRLLIQSHKRNKSSHSQNSPSYQREDNTCDHDTTQYNKPEFSCLG